MKATSIQFLGLTGLAALLMAPILRADIAAVTSPAPSAHSLTPMTTAVIQASPGPIADAMTPMSTAVIQSSPAIADAMTPMPTAVIQPSPATIADALTPVPTAAIQASPNPNAAQGVVEKKYNTVVKTALQPLRDKLSADRAALKEARDSGDEAMIAEAKAVVKADLRAIQAKRVALEHERRGINKNALEDRDKGGDKGSGKDAGKGSSHRDGKDEKEQKHRK